MTWIQGWADAYRSAIERVSSADPSSTMTQDDGRTRWAISASAVRARCSASSRTGDTIAYVGSAIGGKYGARRALPALVTGLLLLAGAPLAAAQAPDVEPRPFAADSVWDTPVPAGTPTDVRSGAFVAELGRQIAAYGPWIATDAYTAPVYT
ncbi:MAG: hypothetical protein JWM73_1025, partial [Solirubrobacterales bacterium]|nr:hypothetical protein [Solirubrobacterales bacterium]